MKDYEFLNWIASRFVHHHGESENVDFVQKLRAIARVIERDDPLQDTPWSVEPDKEEDDLPEPRYLGEGEWSDGR